jgi:hypothetical protein
MKEEEDNNNKKPKKRIEYRGENIRVSRTGGLSATKTFSGDGYGATLNTNHGIRLHKRLFKGARIGFQRGNFQFIGRYSDGPFNFNISKKGVSTSFKHKRGTYNISKPNYSSFKFGGVQIRGKNAVIFSLVYFFFSLIFNFIKLFWQIIKTILWLIFLIVKWFFDFFIGFYKGFNNEVNHVNN